MATVTPGIQFISGETVTPAKLNAAAAPVVAVADGEVSAAKLAATRDLSAKTVTLPNGSVTNDKLSLAANDGEIKKAINADNAPPIFACRAWVNFDGTDGSTIDGEFRCDIRGSGNVSKVVRVSTGRYAVTFTTALPDANYAAVASSSNLDSVAAESTATSNRLSTGFTIYTQSSSGATNTNRADISATVVR